MVWSSCPTGGSRARHAAWHPQWAQFACIFLIPLQDLGSYMREVREKQAAREEAAAAAAKARQVQLLFK